MEEQMQNKTSRKNIGIEWWRIFFRLADINLQHTFSPITSSQWSIQFNIFIKNAIKHTHTLNIKFPVIFIGWLVLIHVLFTPRYKCQCQCIFFNLFWIDDALVWGNQCHFTLDDFSLLYILLAFVDFSSILSFSHVILRFSFFIYQRRTHLLFLIIYFPFFLLQSFFFFFSFEVLLLNFMRESFTRSASVPLKCVWLLWIRGAFR